MFKQDRSSHAGISRCMKGALKMHEWKIREQIAGVENAGVNA